MTKLRHSVVKVTWLWIHERSWWIRKEFMNKARKGVTFIQTGTIYRKRQFPQAHWLLAKKRRNNLMRYKLAEVSLLLLISARETSQ